MRDQDGGAHFDEELTCPAYVAAMRGELTGFLVETEPGITTLFPEDLR
jgi:hypothetical protein